MHSVAYHLINQNAALVVENEQLKIEIEYWKDRCINAELQGCTYNNQLEKVTAHPDDKYRPKA